MLRFVVLSSALLMATNAFAQGNSPRADGFRGLILNQTTAEEALRILGPPVADKTDRLDVAKLSKWLDPKHKEKIFRQLSFRNVGDFSQIHLSFLEDRKSTRLNSSHSQISYAVFCLQKNKQAPGQPQPRRLRA